MPVTLPLKVGDEILTGKFKNKKEIVKSFGTDKNGQPTINGRKMLTFRIVKMWKNEEVELDLEEIKEDIFGKSKIIIVKKIKDLLKYKNEIKPFIDYYKGKKFKTKNGDAILGILNWAIASGVDLEFTPDEIGTIASEIK